MPIKILIFFGLLGLIISAVLGTLVLIAKLASVIPVPGYAATMVTIIFFAALNTFGLGIVGSYVWRAYENTKMRPEALVMFSKEFPKR